MGREPAVHAEGERSRAIVEIGRVLHHVRLRRREQHVDLVDERDAEGLPRTASRDPTYDE